MNAFSFPVKDLFEMIDVVQSSSDDRFIGKKITDSYQKIFGGEQSMYFAPTGDIGGFTDAVKNNIDEKLNRDYKDYFYRFDPLKLLFKNEGEGADADIVKNIDYEACRKSEYYNDFLSPQKIHYKLLAILKNQGTVLGKVLLFRSRKSGNFTKTALRDAKAITPYLANALENKRVNRELERNNGLLRMIENNLKTGIILLDQSRRVIHANDRAREICGLIEKKPIEINNVQDIHHRLVKDFFEMVEEIKLLKSDELLLPRRRVFREDARTFAVQSNLVRDRVNPSDSNFFMINIDEVDKTAEPAAEEHLKEFKLSDREKEVADQVVRGLHNSEIADNLYISEVTVKKHLQNIFRKTGVDNRAALAHTLLSV
ncbi:MAG: LuxR C-terminal-related transcriptional regulator [Treponemataceae bacterium]